MLVKGGARNWYGKNANGLNNPYKYVDPDGKWAEALIIDGPSAAVGVHSFVGNIKNRNYKAAALDAAGVAIDTAAVLAPGIPGGVGLGIKSVRGTEKAKDFFEGTTYTNKVLKHFSVTGEYRR